VSKIGDKVRLVVNGMYRNGVSLFREATFVADSQLLPATATAPNTRVVVLRFAAPAATAEALHQAFQTGDAELNLEGVKPLD